MALGQSGPPATAKQVSYIEALLKQAGYDSLREARHPFGLTQRQSNGKFSKQEASELIDRLLNGEHERDNDREAALVKEAGPAQADLLRGMPADWLADELRRRGWQVSEP